MLAMHPEYQESAFREIYAVMPDKNADLSQDDLDKLAFTDLCIRETLRLFPTAPYIARVASKPIKLKNNIEIPPDVPIVFGLRQIHIQEKYFGPTAHIFNPHRFLDENLKNIPAAAYVPFSYGQRNCIGKLFFLFSKIQLFIILNRLVSGYHYAKSSVKCFTAHLIRNYRVTATYKSIDQLQIVQNMSMKLLGKHMIKVERRDD